MLDRTLSYSTALVCGGLLALAVAGFATANPASPEDQALAQLRRTVAPFHNLSAAQKA